jgi:hypothetical protein
MSSKHLHQGAILTWGSTEEKVIWPQPIDGKLDGSLGAAFSETGALEKSRRRGTAEFFEKRRRRCALDEDLRPGRLIRNRDSSSGDFQLFGRRGEGADNSPTAAVFEFTDALAFEPGGE